MILIDFIVKNAVCFRIDRGRKTSRSNNIFFFKPLVKSTSIHYGFTSMA